MNAPAQEQLAGRIAEAAASMAAWLQGLRGILICEGDLIGKTHEQLRKLHFGRDRDWLQS